ncbi:MAG: hypothetical protein HYT49_00255 [Candidatus Wildermuthbacteria bacterium]|nr:hypothetical protein [Candidatus Wildermuthbacteria bacterium]
MVEKVRVDNIASVGIIYRRFHPDQILIDIKDGGYPLKAFRWMLCPIGGNWIGPTARNDQNTRDTLIREMSEELSLDSRETSTEDAALLGLEPEQATYVVPKKGVASTDEDREKLGRLKGAFANTAEPFGDFLVNVPKSVLDRGVPDNTRPGYTSILSYWRVPVDEEDWATLVDMHAKYGNLSVESIAVIISLEEIVTTRRHTCCGHDRILQQWFASMGCVETMHLPLLPDIFCAYLHQPLASYEEYLERYEVVRHP